MFPKKYLNAILRVKIAGSFVNLRILAFARANLTGQRAEQEISPKTHTQPVHTSSKQASYRQVFKSSDKKPSEFGVSKLTS